MNVYKSSRHKRFFLSVPGVLLMALFIPAECPAWTQGGTGGDIDIGGSITPSGPKNPWEVAVGDAISGLDMSVPESGNIFRHRLTQTLPVLGIRTTGGLDETFGGETAGGIAPQITFEGLLPGPREKGRLPLELTVTRQNDRNHTLGVLRLSLLTGAEVSQKHETTGEGMRYSVYAAQPGEAFHGGLALTPDGAVDDALAQVGDVFPGYKSRYNVQGLASPQGNKGVVEFRNPTLRYSGFYAAGLVRGDEIVLVADQRPGSTELWRASLKIDIVYK